MFRLIRKIIYLVVVFSILGIVWGRFFNPPITITQIQELVRYHKLERDYISYEEMGDHIKRAVIASEDQNFVNHSGFDTKAIEQAVKDNQKRKNRRGGSTISQQTAKNVFLWNGGGWFRKGLEVPYTFAIETLWGKKIILERYLNSIEMGQGVFGIEAASHYYYGKSSKDLTRDEAAWIAAVLPSPKKYDPKHPSRFLRWKHDWILRQMRNVSIPQN